METNEILKHVEKLKKALEKHRDYFFLKIVWEV